MTRTNTQWTALGLLTTMGVAALSPAAMADNQQKNKNNWRNLGYLGAAVAGYGLLKHNSTATVLGAAAGGYGAYRYEKDRHSQSQANDNRRYYYHTGNGRSYGSQYYSGHVPQGHAYGYGGITDNTRHQKKAAGKWPAAFSVTGRVSPKAWHGFRGDGRSARVLLTADAMGAGENCIQPRAGGDEKHLAICAAEANVAGPVLIDGNVLDLVAPVVRRPSRPWPVR